MADTTGSGKRGFRGLFSRRPSESVKTDSGSRRKLSKKSVGSEFELADPVAGFMGTKASRQDSGSFLGDDDAGKRRGTAPALHMRDDPYSLMNVPTGSSLKKQPIEYGNQYARNEGYQQQNFSIPFHTMSNPRSASVPYVHAGRTEQLQHQYSAPVKSPTKLQKADRRPTKVDEILDKDTGERKDLTDMMHAFSYNIAMESEDEKSDHSSMTFDPSKPDGTATLGRASPEIWLLIADYLSPLEVANLSSTCRTMSTRLGRYPYKLLLKPANRVHRMEFLLDLDRKLPRHLFCFPCLQWHLRIQPGLEKLKPHNVLNPLFVCPNQTNVHLPPPRIRISEGRTLPFAFIQLARRSWAFGSEFGITHQSLSRRWKDTNSKWTHESTYHVTDKGHVLMRVKSQHYVHGGMTDAAKRMLLFSREDYTPYFSVCSHWKHGILTSIPKCALGHIPYLNEFNTNAYHIVHDKVYFRKANGVINLCNTCRPMRRCPKCPTEYLFELKVVEDKTENMNSPERFKQALLVTRWSDLGPARSPLDAEWAAIVGENDEYDGIKEIKNRAVSGVFESAFSDTIPGQRILSMNPKGVVANQESGDWY